ncbi:MAG: cytochrome c3 family protein [Anaerosomatales bacterium]|nr:cytochrome c3 family protein [Anaerosomatales bacterium]
MSALWRDIQRLAGLIGEVIAAPTANLSAALLLLAALALLLLIVVTVIALLVLPSPKPPRKRARAAGVELQRDGKTVARRRARAPLIAVLVTVALALGYAGTGTDQFCVSCHADLAMASAAGSSGSTETPGPANLHGEVRCVRCHEETLPIGLVSNVAARIRFGVRYAMGADPNDGVASVPTRRCVGCHRTILDRTTESSETGVAMSHAEPVRSGVPCLECHKNAGHRSGSQGVSMNTCLRCHDGSQASAECSACHTKDTAFAVRTRRTFSFVHLPPVTDCGGCHDQRSCDACHGLRMPHPKDFLDGEHARQAGFEKKELCWRCHTYLECGKCHAVKPPGQGAWGHGTGDWWRKEHGRSTPKGAQTGCGCHGRSPYARAGNYCKACH